MKYLFQIGIVLFFPLILQGQSQVILEIGKVSFVSSRNVYAKFKSTENITIGDTLFINQNEALVPVLIVDNKSSSSTVCTPIGTNKLGVDDQIIAQIYLKTERPEIMAEEALPASTETEGIDPSSLPQTPETEGAIEEVLFKEKVKGRISVATYNNFSSYRNSTRMRYAFMYKGYNLKNSRFSVDSYITFRHTLGEPIQGGITDALKVFSLSVKYDFDQNSNLVFGRKINPKISSLGAVDGLQYEKGLGNFRLGAIAGTRPNFANYNLDINLPQFGAYVSYVSPNTSKYSQTTLGFIEQRNKNATDRRFVYFQHSGALAKNLNLFSSFEIDLYENINNEVKNTAQLTNLFVSLRYRLSRKWRLSASYDTRKNIIYYESYKNFIDRFIDNETRQGFRVGLSHRLSKRISWGLNGNMRFQQSQRNPSQNLSAYVSISKVPFINARATVRANMLQTDFIDSRIFGARLSKPLIKNKLNADVYYRWVDYAYKTSERTVHQNIAGFNLSWRIQKQLSLNLYYEGVFEATNTSYHRFNARIIKRF